MIVGLGVDIVELSRVRGIYARYGERFTGRVLTAAEAAYCATKHDPVPNIAARFAAKEAAAKALGTGIARGIAWRDIEVARQRGEAPTVVFHRRAAARATMLGAVRAHLTLTHGKDAAVAVVVLEA
jgi:holo-[acyl-carrier protein] synthase